jgi:hypothetical protein
MRLLTELCGGTLLASQRSNKRFVILLFVDGHTDPPTTVKHWKIDKLLCLVSQLAATPPVPWLLMN